MGVDDRHGRPGRLTQTEADRDEDDADSLRRRSVCADPLLALGVAGIVPWRLVPHPAIGQELPAASRPADDRRGDALAGLDAIEFVRSRLATAQWRIAAGKTFLREVEAKADAAAATRVYREKQVGRIKVLVDQGAVEARLLDEEEDRLRVARAEERGAKLDLDIARARLEFDVADAGEAQALIDSGRARAPVDPEAKAQADLIVAELNRLMAAAAADEARARADEAAAAGTSAARNSTG